MPSRFRMLVSTLCAVATLSACATNSSAPVEHLTVEIIATHPFDEDAFTQGLELADDRLLVGTGLEGKSRIFYRMPDGRETNSTNLDPEFFGEGVTRTGNTVWQLTWRHGTAIKRDADTLAEVGRASYSGEGWGLCSFADRLVMSDGTSQLRELDPNTFVELHRIQVTRNGEPVDRLNELECVDDSVYANRFLTDEILRIDAATGAVTATIDASGLDSGAQPDTNNVLNGIAHIPDTDRFYLTGKRWPKLFEVRFVPAH
ncbi:glutaminyl-peptide cyclotransferase [Corynebacterium sp.]|uniref:glutaminyl-peptide cyclotransferase n=1 Tax=Corynebacterium sp. TaxID=1720 RepID=UPI0026DB4854|nr:glutaminyl-peptide cyclotransferase [Corynebacterium sp.]MDO5076265.1 glutaminyl-peptide cyclotransferase [Corynebacterium sp.]